MRSLFATNHETWQMGTEVVASYKFPGGSLEDLPFNKGDILTIIKATRDPNWYQAKNSYGREGMIPANYVQKRQEVSLQTMPWYHGKVSREEAESLLAGHMIGSFLVRENGHYPGDYTLSLVIPGDVVEHYRVLQTNNKVEVDGGDLQFDTLLELVEHYEKDADGLCTRLSKPLWKTGNNFTTVDFKDFERGGWVINAEYLEIKEPIGKGEFGDVYKGCYNQQLVAVKQLKDRNRAAQTFLKEASVMTSMRHPNLVQLIGVVLGENIFLVTEFMGKGNLVEYLRSRGRSVITKRDQINFATDTCAGMAYLEAKNLVHRDLAARNVLVHEDGTAKVSDFGLAKFESFSQEGGRFPIKWTAPEAIRKNVFTSKSDVWSFGILLWEIYSFGRVPYPRIPLAEVVRHVERGYRMETPDGCPPEIYQIMRHTWDIDPNHRPLFQDILKMLHNLHATTV
ncbi:tyrosine-protein kinase CSK isoform X3 [Octopus bimaculoides]|uniref:tyrosine-protein kinase CSK isoform X3 n=1 Tax=Octopus bimaculoides TaxID=37653 RepID=UPI00071C39C9|nr:tyrosine-protein kinase CSK isoform X3 [Octopus bimaculoides]|eukprot:XP_014781693.1 PREDICTED: tyrosine-protein kinase CSK-like isoform X3 [Octopus bimaculoides]